MHLVEQEGNESFRISREQILATYEAGPEAIVALIEHMLEKFLVRLEQQEQRIKALEQELKKDSHNSGKPPSRDSFERKQVRGKKPRAERKKRAGGQKGHQGTTLRMVATPDAVRVHKVDTCSCGRSLRREPVVEYERRQVFDIPEIQMQVTEHRAEHKKCRDCGQISAGEFPQGVRQQVQYGSRLQAYAVYLRNYGLMPYQRAAELFEDLFSISLSPATLVNINGACGRRLAGVSEAIRAAIIKAPVICCDETGMSINGKLNWLHVASTESLTYYAAHPKRGQQAFAAIDILPHFQGIAMHDHWRSYFRCECSHALCNAHHLRELTFIHEEYRQNWARDLSDLLLEIKGAVETAIGERRVRLYRQVRKRFANQYRRILREGLRANPPSPQLAGSPKKRGRRKQSKPRNLLLRLKTRSRETLAFMYDFRVHFDNNQAERDLRMMKVQQKISGTFRSADAAAAFCRTRGYISTIRKNGIRVIDALQSAFLGEPIIPPCLTPAE